MERKNGFPLIRINFALKSVFLHVFLKMRSGSSGREHNEVFDSKFMARLDTSCCSSSVSVDCQCYNFRPNCSYPRSKCCTNAFSLCVCVGGGVGWGVLARPFFKGWNRHKLFTPLKAAYQRKKCFPNSSISPQKFLLRVSNLCTLKSYCSFKQHQE